MSIKPFWTKPLAALNADEWEALCDGCGLCCLNKVEDEDTGELHFTRVACNLLDCTSCQCSNYVQRKHFVPDCVTLTLDTLHEQTWLPSTCAYVLRAAGKPLHDWHYLISGSRLSVHEAGISARNFKPVLEQEAGEVEDYLDYPLKKK